VGEGTTGSEAGRLGGPVAELREGGMPLSLREMVGRMGWRNIVDGTVPVTSFLVLNAALGLRWAIVGATACSVVLALVRRSRGQRPGVVLWGSLAFLVARGAVGAVTQSKIAYFGPGIATTYLAAAVFLGSVVAGRPAIGVAFRFVFGPPEARVPEQQVRRVFLQLSLAWGVYELVAALLQTWLLRSLSVGTFVVARQIVNTGGTVPMVAWSLYRLRGVVPRRRPAAVAAAGVPSEAGK
jgi:hypothetical protein